jgi:hypothetical protein
VVRAGVFFVKKHASTKPSSHPTSVPSVCSDLASEFEFAERIYRFWQQRYRAELEHSDLPSRVSTVAILLTTQACRLYRSIIEECRRCEGFSANVLTRSLYETLIALKFVVKKSVRIIVAPTVPGADTYSARPPSRNNRAIGKASVSLELRACLYVLHAQLESERLLRKCGATPGLKRLLRVKRPGPAAQQVRAAIQKFVGPEWTYIVSHKPHTYSGLSIETLARLVDSNRKLSQWYAGPYHLQAGMAHAAAAHRHTQIGTDGGIELAFHSAADEIRGTIQIAAAMLLACIVTVQNEVSGTTALGRVVEGLEKDFKRIFGTDA